MAKEVRLVFNGPEQKLDTRAPGLPVACVTSYMSTAGVRNYPLHLMVMANRKQTSVVMYLYLLLNACMCAACAETCATRVRYASSMHKHPRLIVRFSHVFSDLNCAILSTSISQIAQTTFK